MAGLQAAKEVLLLQPYCFRAHDVMADDFGVSTQHVTNMIGPQALEQFLSIADHYKSLKQWEKARPFAEEAAQTWAGWAMNCAARCAGGEKDWERAVSERKGRALRRRVYVPCRR